MLQKDLLHMLCLARDKLRLMQDSPLSVQQIADEVGMSLYHFIRLYKAVFGETPNQYQIRMRLEKAKLLLVASDLSITDVCMEVGYSSLGTFSDLFSRRFGMAPSVYRQKFRPVEASCSEVPRQFIPDCFSLMGGMLDQQSNIREAPPI